MSVRLSVMFTEELLLWAGHYVTSMHWGKKKPLVGAYLNHKDDKKPWRHLRRVAIQNGDYIWKTNALPLNQNFCIYCISYERQLEFAIEQDLIKISHLYSMCVYSYLNSTKLMVKIEVLNSNNSISRKSSFLTGQHF